MFARLAPRSIRGLAISVSLAAALVVILLGVATYVVVHHEIERQLDHRIELETEGLLELQRAEGFARMAQAVQDRDRRKPELNTGYLATGAAQHRGMGYILLDAQGVRRAGALDADMPPLGWSEFLQFHRPDGTLGIAQALNTRLPDGGWLLVAADRTIVDQTDLALLKIFGVQFALIALVIAAAAAGLGRIIHLRISGLMQSAEAIMAGDLSRRMPVDGSGSEFDQLAVVLNRMLDRISALMDNLRQVSSDIAHDLRTPVHRLRTRIEAATAAQDAGERRDHIQAALAQADLVLDLFTGLLAISEVDGKAIRHRFGPVRLDEAVREICEAYGPSLESAGINLTLRADEVTVTGDKPLLQRAVSNLLDNLIAHAGPNVCAQVLAARQGDRALITISDDGPGVPADQRTRIFERLARLDPARSKPGHGLGLSLVASIAAAHRGEALAVDSDRGLAIRISLPLA